MTNTIKYLLRILFACIALLMVTISLSLFISNMMWHEINFVGAENIILHNSLLDSYDKLIIKCKNGFPKLLLENGTITYNKSYIVIDLTSIHNLATNKRDFIIVSCTQPTINRTTNDTLLRYNNKIDVTLENTKSYQNIVALILLILGSNMIIVLNIDMLKNKKTQSTK